MRRRGPARRQPGGGGASRGRASAKALARPAGTREDIAVRVSESSGWRFGSSVTVAATNSSRSTNAGTLRTCPQLSPPGRSWRLRAALGNSGRAPPAGLCSAAQGVFLRPRPLFTARRVWFADFTQRLHPPFPTPLFTKGEETGCGGHRPGPHPKMRSPSPSLRVELFRESGTSFKGLFWLTSG